LSLARIAVALDLSVTTVSRALGGYPDVSAPTRARVFAEAGRINYAPNRTAQRLQRGRTDTVGVILPAAPGQFDDPFFLRMLMAFGIALERAGLDMIVTSVRAGAGELAAFERLIASRRVDGMLIARTRCNDQRIGAMLDGGMPFVTHGR
jgi:LacI family transcriptional regulator